jgi:hypothetical protein
LKPARNRLSIISQQKWSRQQCRDHNFNMLVRFGNQNMATHLEMLAFSRLSQSCDSSFRANLSREAAALQAHNLKVASSENVNWERQEIEGV